MSKKRDGLTLRNGVYYISYKHRVTGKRIRISADTTIKEKAAELRERLVGESWDQKHTKAEINWTIIELMDWAWRTEWSTKENADKKQHDSAVKSFLAYSGLMLARELSGEEIKAYIFGDEKKTIPRRLNDVKKSSVNRELSYFRSAYNLAIEDGKLLFNPFRKIKIFSEEGFKRDRVATNEERRILIEHSAGTLQDAIEFDFNTGLRKGELESLKWTAVDLIRKTARVRSIKGDKEIIRDVPLFKEALAVLARRPRASEYVFCNPEGNKIPEDGLIKSGFQRLIERTGIKDFHFHDIRHSFATAYYLRTKNIVAISYILGHRDIETTMGYLNLKPENLVPSADFNLWPKLDPQIKEAIRNIAKMTDNE